MFVSKVNIQLLSSAQNVAAPEKIFVYLMVKKRDLVISELDYKCVSIILAKTKASPPALALNENYLLSRW